MYNVKCSVRGEYELFAQKMETVDGIEVPVGKRRLLTKGKNLITNTGMDNLGTTLVTGFNWGRYCHVGSGNTAPAVTDTALVARVAVQDATTNGGNSVNSWEGNVRVVTITSVFATGAAAGVLAELGLSQSSSVAANINTRALFTDEEGDPITVTVLSDEQLVVVYRLLFTADTTDSVLVTTTGPDDTEYTLTLRPSALGSAAVNYTSLGYSGSNAHTYSGGSSAIGAATASPTGTDTQASYTSAMQSYVSGNFYRDVIITQPLGVVNGVDIGAVKFEGFPAPVQIGISPRINKAGTETIRYTIRYTWSRG